MSYEKRKKERVVAEFNWKIAEAERQVKSDFPLARMTNDFASAALLEILKGSDQESQLQYLRATAKSQNKVALSLVGQKLTPQDDELVKEVNNLSGRLRQSNWQAWHSGASKEPSKITKGKLTTQLTAGLKEVIGPMTSRMEDNLYFTTPVSEWFLRTILLIGRRHPFTIDIFHQLLRWPDEQMPLGECTYFVVGRWEVSSQADIHSVVESLNGISRFALDATPEIVDQISSYTPFPTPENAKYATGDNTWSDSEQTLVNNISAAMREMDPSAGS